MGYTSYVPHVEGERRAMLETIGVESLDELYRDIPAELRQAAFNLPPGQTEIELEGELRALASRNRTDLLCFLGGGFYEHHIPAAVDAVLTRGEFYTAYTPYQPEVSQGTLQTAFEFQSGICRLTGMQVANASLYDGGSALYEALLMAVRITGRRKFLVDQGVSPIYRRMLTTYCAKMDVALVEVATKAGVVDRARIKSQLDDGVAGLVLQYPNFFGCIEDLTELIEAVQAAGGLGVVSTYPVALGLLKPPGEMGADIVVGEAQSLGIPLSFGGPYLGFMATRKKLVRKMPGRIVGMTHDARDRRGFVLTLQAREQHIRREKATSNICTNQNLCAIAAAVYMALLGKQGLRDVAELCADNASYAYGKLTAIPGVSRTFKPFFFNEFCITLPRDARDVIGDMIDRGFAMGFPVGRYYPEMEKVALIAVTEMRTKEDIDHLAAALEGVLRQ
jgi:glycine dehydrogenase subunit 1